MWIRMLAKFSNVQLMQLRKYHRVAVYLFRRLTVGLSPSNFPLEIYFDLDDVRAAMTAAVTDGLIPHSIKNLPDLKYLYDAREDFPEEIEQCGPLTWISIKKGQYKFVRTRRKNLINLPHELNFLPPLEIEVDVTPTFIAGLLGTDEQAVFTRVRNAGLISKFLGFQAWPIQGHHRTSVSYGQIEVDEVQAGIDNSLGTIVPISGKGGSDRLSWSQALNLNTYGREKPPMAGMVVRSLGLWRDPANTIWIVEFSPETDINAIEIVGARRFVFGH